jgi:hypothetical protein
VVDDQRVPEFRVEIAVLDSLLKYLAAPAIVVGGLGWILKTILSENLKREADRLRAKLESDNAVAPANLRSHTMQYL